MGVDLLSIGADRSARAYRRDIDGMRAIAILSVAFYHAGVPTVRGGLTGVDIFFVISGYLIGGHIYSELLSDNFSYLYFYRRRAKRILPAFFGVLVFVFLIALALMSPVEVWETARAGLAATLSASNVLFWRTAGYFDARSELNPLLMTWSLGVEEQFYLVIPLLMAILIRIRKRWILPAILVVCAISFVFACWGLRRHPIMAFYMLPARAWELGAGVALAVSRQTWKRGELAPLRAQLLSATGLALTTIPIFLIGKETTFPGLAAPLSVLGTILLLATPQSWVNRCLLSVRPLVFVGKVSYSWYLWHWPLLAFARLCYERQPPLGVRLVAILAAFGAAVLSYFYIERPFRSSKTEAIPLLTRYALVSAAFLALCAFLVLGNGFPQRFPRLARMESGIIRLQSAACLASYGADKPYLGLPCYDAKDERPAVALWGDSHSAALAPGLRSVAAAQGYGFVQLTKSSCLPLIGAARYMKDHPREAEECFRFNQTALDTMNADPRVRVVVLTGLWSRAFHPERHDTWLTANVAHEADTPTMEATSRLFVQAMQNTVRALQTATRTVVVLEDVPGFEFDPVLKVRAANIPMRRLLTTSLHGDGNIDPGFAPIADPSGVAMTSTLLDRALSGVSDVQRLSLNEVFCGSSTQCTYRSGDVLLYADNQHLSPDGAVYALRGFSLPALAVLQQIDATARARK